MAIKTRETTATGVTNKGAPLTNAELDNNFVELVANKVELDDLSVTTNSAGTAALSYDNTTGVFSYTPPDLSNAGGGIELTDLSVTQNSAGTAALSYDNTTGVFSYTPPNLSSYLTSESDTLATVTGRGATTSTNSTFSGTLTVDSHFTVNTDTLHVNAQGSQIAFGTTTAATGYDLTVKDPNGTASSEAINWKFDVSSAGTVRSVDIDFVGFTTGSIGLSGSAAGGTFLENSTGGCGLSAKGNGTVGLYTNGSIISPDVVLDGSGNLDISANVIVDGFVEADSFRTGSAATTALTLTSTGSATVGEDLTVTGNFTSTGIDDNATSTAVTIDSSQRVGLGQATPSRQVHLKSAQSIVGTVESTLANFPATLTFRDAGETITEGVRIGAEDDSCILQTNGTTRLSIDSAGDVGIGNGAITSTLDVHSTTAASEISVEGSGGKWATLISGTGTTGPSLCFDDTSTRFRICSGSNKQGSGQTEIFTVNTGGVTFEKAIEEQQYSLTGTAIDPANGTIQYKTLSANTTFTESLSDGEFVTLMIDDGSNRTVTWPTTTWIGGSAPVLQTSGYNVIELWHVNGTLYGAFVGTA